MKIQSVHIKNFRTLKDVSIADKIAIGSLEAAGISIVPVGGKTMIPLAHAILTSIGIPVYALFDADEGTVPEMLKQILKKAGGEET